MKLKKGIKPVAGVIGFSVGSALIGDALNSQPLKDAGTTAGKFVTPMVNIHMAGYMVDQLKNLRIKKR